MFYKVSFRRSTLELAEIFSKAFVQSKSNIACRIFLKFAVVPYLMSVTRWKGNSNVNTTLHNITMIFVKN